MATDFTLKIFVPAGLVLEAKVTQVSLVTLDGEVTVLPGHVEYVSAIGVGILRYEGAAQGKVVVVGGVCNFANEILTVLADTVDLPDTIDRVNFAKDKASLEAIVAGGSTFEPAWERASAQLKRIEAVQGILQ